MGCQCIQLPAHPLHGLEKVDKRFNEISGYYEKHVIACTSSGYHRTFDNTDQRASPDTNKSVLYMHYSVRQSKDVICAVC